MLEKEPFLVTCVSSRAPHAFRLSGLACHRPSLRSVSTGPKQVAQQARDNDANMAPSPDDPPPPAMYPGLWITFKGIFGNIGKHLGYILAAFWILCRRSCQRLRENRIWSGAKVRKSCWSRNQSIIQVPYSLVCRKGAIFRTCWKMRNAIYLQQSASIQPRMSLPRLLNMRGPEQRCQGKGFLGDFQYQ